MDIYGFFIVHPNENLSSVLARCGQNNNTQLGQFKVSDPRHRQAAAVGWKSPGMTGSYVKWEVRRVADEALLQLGFDWWPVP